ncbi:hypothetical protein CFC21_107243 [Triticum aestivum]|uniref:Uncharacterized protein n=2 Tax=Triticum aestivum TaxID=4565 RepID=A0A3B6TJ09_WHEAT|nr:hypothetical protein CFC21_107243 [Triticum aestivum]
MCSYFIVVDDIWKKETWDVIKYAFPMTSCGIIITTTRMKDVANSCQTSFGGHIYNIRPLDIVYSRQLFHGRLFNSEENCPPYLKEVSDQILKKCDGLPLAIIAISGLLANTERIEGLWNQVKDSIGRALERNSSVEGMMKILSLSYFDLPPHLKTCLLYVSIFPEDSFIGKNDIISRWIGEEFIHKEGRYTSHEIGERCFNELLNRGLIQPGKTNEYGEVESCQVHDTILDFIISKSIEENFVTLLGVPILTIGTQSKVVRRLFLQGINQGNSTIQPAGLVLSHVRSLGVFGGFVEIPSLEEFKHLCVLHLSHCQSLEEHHLENIVRLPQLRYLNLKNTEIRKLPEQIGRLGCLELLDLRHTCVEELPASIVNLKKLTHLLVDYGVKFPDGIEEMQALETLEEVRFSNQPFGFLSGLGQLKNLRNLVLFFGFEEYSDTKDANMVEEECIKSIISSLCKLGTQDLRSLTIWDWSSLLQEPLCPLTLDRLINFSLGAPQVPKWVSSLRNLQEIHLIVDEVKQDDLCILGALPTLLILHLEEETMSNKKIRVSGEVGFQFLRIFIYEANPHPVDLMFAAGSMPKLEKLVLSFRIAAGSLDFGIKNLPCLSTVKCSTNADDGIFGAIQTAVERAASTHPNHPSLLFRRDVKCSTNKAPYFSPL